MTELGYVVLTAIIVYLTWGGAWQWNFLKIWQHAFGDSLNKTIFFL
jgi:hypothetical protein